MAQSYGDSDGEDWEEQMMRSGRAKVTTTSGPPIHTTGFVVPVDPRGGTTRKMGAASRHASSAEPSYQIGQLVDRYAKFASVRAIKGYPYKYTSRGNKVKGAPRFFDQDQLFDRQWDLFYLHRPQGDHGQPLLLVLTDDFVAFLEQINRQLGTSLTFPPTANACLAVTFEDTGCPRPRFLGRARSHADVLRLKDNIPWPSFTPPGEQLNMGHLDSSHPALRIKLDDLRQAELGKNQAGKDKRAADRVAKRQSWGHSLKRVEKYLGLRPWGTIDDRDLYHPDRFPRFAFEDEVIFIAVDVEAYERSQSIITEVGIAVLDVRDLLYIEPGPAARNWHYKIRGRHFRISENASYVNKDFVKGCADKFEFGTSEFVSKCSIAQTIASCFKLEPLNSSNKLESLGSSSTSPKRSIVLVGHAPQNDVEYMQKLGYDVTNLSNLLETVNTEHLWQFANHDPNPRALGGILSDLGIVAWNLHNAGNDAVYTLQAMLGIAMKHLELRQAEFITRRSTTKSSADEGWESDGGDGGSVKPRPAEEVRNRPPTMTSSADEGWESDGGEGGSVKPRPARGYFIGACWPAFSPPAASSQSAASWNFDDMRHAATEIGGASGQGQSGSKGRQHIREERW